MSTLTGEGTPEEGSAVGGVAMAVEARPADRSAGGAEVGRRRVLIVDDEQSILSAMRRLLRREPYEILTVTCGTEAIQVLEECPVHLLIVDQRMPGCSGTDLLREVRERWPETIRMILSGYSEVSSIIASVNDGAIYKFISKPWNDEELKLHVRRAIEQYDLEAENRRMADELIQANERLKDLNRKLDQRVADAMIGLDYTQELLNVMEAGVITVDETGLVVNANSRACQLMDPSRGEIVGESVGVALPAPLFQAIFGQPRQDQPASSGRLECGGRSLQWRARRVSDTMGDRGTVISIWEDIP